MKFRVIPNQDFIIIITEDGGVACIDEAEDISDDEPRTAKTEFYQSRFTNIEGVTSENVFSLLSEGKMYITDWDTAHFHSQETITDALNWLCVGETEWTKCDDLFLDIFPNS